MNNFKRIEQKMQLSDTYQGLIKKGYRAKFVRDKLADHYGVHERTILRWITTNNMSKAEISMLSTFNISN